MFLPYCQSPYRTTGKMIVSYITFFLLEAWTSLCVYSVFMLFCVQVAALRRADPPSKVSYRLDYETEKATRDQQRAEEPLMNE
jgi:hypothetical protein